MERWSGGAVGRWRGAESREEGVHTGRLGEQLGLHLGDLSLGDRTSHHLQIRQLGREEQLAQCLFRRLGTLGIYALLHDLATLDFGPGLARGTCLSRCLRPRLSRCPSRRARRQTPSLHMTTRVSSSSMFLVEIVLCNAVFSSCKHTCSSS